MKLPTKVFAVVFCERGNTEESCTLVFANSEDEIPSMFPNAEVKEYVELRMAIPVSEGNYSLSSEVIHDEVNSPNHYCKGGIECIDVIKAATEGLVGMEAVCTANIIKYIFRWKDKNGTVDVKKCEWYVKRLIQELESNNEAI